jgi:hypothetical protein
MNSLLNLRRIREAVQPLLTRSSLTMDPRRKPAALNRHRTTNEKMEPFMPKPLTFLLALLVTAVSLAGQECPLADSSQSAAMGQAIV